MTRRQSSPPARKTVLILFEFLIFPSFPRQDDFVNFVPQLCVLCESPLSSCLRVTVAHHFFFSYLCLAVCSCLCVILKVKNIKFSSVPPLIFLQQCPTFLSSRAFDPQYRFFGFCTLYLLNFSLLILHCIFSSPTSPRRKNFFHTISGHLGTTGSSTPC